MTGGDSRFGPGGAREGRELNSIDPEVRRKSNASREPLDKRLADAKVMLAGTVYSELFDEASREIAFLRRAMLPGVFSRTLKSIRLVLGK